MKKRIAFIGVGGQGTLLASRLLGEVVMSAGYDVRVSEVHGMAQRGGVVESAVMIGGIQGPVISRGMADVLLSMEPLETLRAIDLCNQNSVVISNTVPILPASVKMGVEQYPEVDEILNFLRPKFPNFYSLDAVALAKEAGTPKAANTVLLGVLAGLSVLRLSIDQFKKAIESRVKAKYVEQNLKAFDLGVNSVSSQSV